LTPVPGPPSARGSGPLLRLRPADSAPADLALAAGGAARRRAGLAAFYVYTKIEDQLAGAKPVAVPYVEGKVQRLAAAELREAGLKPEVRLQANEKENPGRVFSQDPAGGTRVDKGTTVVIFVSTGKAKTTVPDVIGKARDEAVALLTAAHLKVNVVEV
jgi:hypothetical protein